MSKLLRKDLLREDSSYHISKMKTSIDSLIATHAAIATAHHTEPTDFYTQAEIDAMLNTAIPPSIYGGDQGFLKILDAWYVLNADPNARLWGSFICPETRADWKVILITMNSVGNQFVSGTLSMGATGDNEVDSSNNIHNNINWDITHPAVAYTYEFKITAAFSATERDVIRYHYATDANDGAGTIYVMGFVLVHD